MATGACADIEDRAVSSYGALDAKEEWVLLDALVQGLAVRPCALAPVVCIRDAGRCVGAIHLSATTLDD
jgi:hypothetical protein